VIKNVLPDTGMIGFAGQLTDEEIWSIIQYERTFSLHHGPRQGMRGMGSRGPMGPRGGMEQEHLNPPETGRELTTRPGTIAVKPLRSN
jgi:hypothetical protein